MKMNNKKLKRCKIEIIKEMKKSIIPKLNYDFNILEFLNILCVNFKSDYCDYTPKELKIRIIDHSKRVYENVLIIIKFLESNNIRIFNDDEKEDLKFVALVHDVGKVYKDKNHNVFSKIIIEYLFDYFNIKDNNRKERIIEMIYYHNKKDENKELISDLTMIIRDADLFDEQCGRSLSKLTLSQTIDYKNKNRKNLNHINYEFSDSLINLRSSNEYMNEIKKLINMPCNIFLYEELVKAAVKEYDEKTDFHRLKYDNNKLMECIDKSVFNNLPLMIFIK